MRYFLGSTSLKRIEESIENVLTPTSRVTRIYVMSFFSNVGTTTVASLLAEFYSRYRSSRVVCRVVEDGLTSNVYIINGEVVEDLNFVSSSAEAEANGVLPDYLFDVAVYDFGCITANSAFLNESQSSDVVCFVTPSGRRFVEYTLGASNEVVEYCNLDEPFIILNDYMNEKSPWPKLAAQRLSWIKGTLSFEYGIREKSVLEISSQNRETTLELAGDLMAGANKGRLR